MFRLACACTQADLSIQCLQSEQQNTLDHYNAHWVPTGLFVALSNIAYLFILILISHWYAQW